jgi:ethanolamine utilization protein EutA (predicted chaperonin)
MMHSPKPNQRVKLLGLDFGSTTSSALVAEASVTSNCITGRMEFGAPQVVFKSTPVFTPFIQGSIDEVAIAALIRQWLVESGLPVSPRKAAMQRRLPGWCVSWWAKL